MQPGGGSLGTARGWICGVRRPHFALTCAASQMLAEPLAPFAMRNRQCRRLAQGLATENLATYAHLIGYEQQRRSSAREKRDG
jgi:hypothetical protein